jgi:hypothetical protein
MLHLQATQPSACWEVKMKTTAHMRQSFLISFDPTFAKQLGRGAFMPTLMLKLLKSLHAASTIDLHIGLMKV